MAKWYLTENGPSSYKDVHLHLGTHLSGRANPQDSMVGIYGLILVHHQPTMSQHTTSYHCHCTRSV